MANDTLKLSDQKVLTEARKVLNPVKLDERSACAAGRGWVCVHERQLV